MTKHNNDRNPLINLLLGAGGIVGGWLAYSKLWVDHEMPLPPALNAPRDDFHGARSTFLSYYSDTSADGRPLLLLHSINAAASSYEIRPLFEHYRGKRPVYALDLPGYGFSERADREYTPQLFVNAILDFIDHIGVNAIDVIALSLTSEFIASAALQQPDAFHSLVVLSPTGLAGRSVDKSTQDSIYNFLSFPLLSQPLYDLLTIRPSIRFFLERAFAGEADEGLIEYAYQTSHQPGARYAPYYFVSGKLFTFDILATTYAKLTVPAMILYDKDPNVTFEQLPTLLQQNDHWRARRIPHTLGLPHFERLDKTVEELELFWSELAEAKA